MYQAFLCSMSDLSIPFLIGSIQLGAEFKAIHSSPSLLIKNIEFLGFGENFD